MKKIIEFFVKQSLFGDVITVGVLVVGAVSITLIQREAFPNIAFDVIAIESILPGASPDDTERLLTNTIEQDLKEVDGIKKIQSYSVENLSRIVVFLDPDQTTEKEGKSDIQDVVDRINDLPTDTQKPLVTSMESKFTPIIEVSLAGEGVDELRLREIAKDLEDEIEKLPGVARVVPRGLRDLEIRVEPNLQQLSRYRLSLDELITALARQNISIPGGLIETHPNDPDSRERYVRTTGEFTDLAGVENTVIRANDLGIPVRIKDVAKVSYALERAQLLNRANGIPSLALTVLKKEKADAITLVDQLKERLDQIKPSLDEGVSLSYINDVSQFIRRRLSVLTGNLLIGLTLVVLILPLLMPFKFSLIISLGVPFAFLGATTLLYNWGISINLISMMGLIIVTGILVDDAIVVTENAAANVEKGMDPKTAAIEGTAKLVAPVTASVLTTMMAFLPMMFMSGIFGKFIKYIPIGVIVCLVVSLLEAFFILPGHVANFIKVRPKNATSTKKPTALKRLFRFTRSFWDIYVVPRYIAILRIFIARRYWVMTALVVLFVGSIGLAVKGMRFILFPPEGIEIFFVRTEAPLGTSLEQHAKLIEPIEKLVKELPKEELDNFTTSIGLVQQDPNDPNTKRGAEYAQIAVYLTPDANRSRSAQEILESLREQIGTPPDFKRITFGRVNPGPPTGKPVSLGIRGENYEDMLVAAEGIKKILSEIDGVTDILDSYTLGKEEIRVAVKPQDAAAANLTVAQIANSVRAVYEGVEATKIRKLNEEIVVRVSLPKDQRTTLDSLKKINVPNASGQLIPLSQIATFDSHQGVSVHEHEANQRQIRVTADVDTNKTSSLEVNGAIKKLLPDLNQKFPKVSIQFGGEDEDTQESLASLGRAFGLAVIGILLILVMTFKNLVQPFLVLLTIPLGIIAVIWAFFFHGMPLSFMGMLGVVALAGVIVNNAIVFVDFVNQSREDGHSQDESIFEAARQRIRPIFLTTATTVAGILPTAYGIGGEDKFVVPIAMALGWGVMFGSLLTAFIFPAALAVMDDVRGFIHRKFGFTRI